MQICILYYAFFCPQNPRKVIHLWAEKEMHNLNRIAKAKIPCPPVVLLKKHILVLGFIGEDMKPAPTLKEVNFPKDDDKFLLSSAYNQLIEVSINEINQGFVFSPSFYSNFKNLYLNFHCILIDYPHFIQRVQTCSWRSF